MRVEALRTAMWIGLAAAVLPPPAAGDADRDHIDAAVSIAGAAATRLAVSPPPGTGYRDTVVSVAETVSLRDYRAHGGKTPVTWTFVEFRAATSVDHDTLAVLRDLTSEIPVRPDGPPRGKQHPRGVTTFTEAVAWSPAFLDDGAYDGFAGAILGSRRIKKGQDLTSFAEPLARAVLTLGPLDRDERCDDDDDDESDNLGHIKIKVEREDGRREASVRVKLHSRAAQTAFDAEYGDLVRNIESRLLAEVASESEWELRIAATAPFAPYLEIIVDRVPPELAILEPAERTATNDASVEFLAAFSDPGAGIDADTFRVQIGDEDVTTALTVLADSAGGSPPIPGEGAWTIAAQIADAAGNVATAERTFVADYSPPIFTYLSPDDGFATNDPFEPVVAAFADNLAGVDPESIAFVLDGMTVPSCPSIDCAVGVTVLPTGGWAEGVAHWAFLIADRAGNIAISESRALVADFTPPVITGVEPADGAVVGTNTPFIAVYYEDSLAGVRAIDAVAFGEVPVSDFFTVTPVSAYAIPPADDPPPDGPLPLSFVVIDAAGNRSVPGGTTFDIDTQAPVIVIESPPDGYETFDAAVKVRGKATDAHLAAISLNGLNVPFLADGSFLATTALQPATNGIHVLAIDTLGARSERAINVIRRMSEGPVIEFHGIEDGAVLTTAEQLPTAITASYSDPDGVDLARVEVYYDRHDQFPLTRDQINELIQQSNPELAALGFQVPLAYFSLVASMTRNLLLQLGRPPEEIAAAIQLFRDQHIYADHVVLPARVDGEGQFKVCVEAFDLIGNRSERCASWIADVFAPIVSIAPAEGTTLLAGPPNVIRIRAYDPSRYAFLTGSTRGPDPNGRPLPPGCCQVLLNGGDVTQALVPVTDGVFELRGAALAPMNTISVTALDGFHTTLETRSFHFQDPADFFAAFEVGPDRSIDKDWVLSFFTAFPYLHEFPEFTTLTTEWFDELYVAVVNELTPQDMFALLPIVEANGDPRILSTLRGLVVQTMTRLAGEVNDPRLDQAILRAYRNGNVMTQLGVISGNSSRPINRRLDLALPQTPHILVQYRLSGYDGIPSEASFAPAAAGGAARLRLASAPGLPTASGGGEIARALEVARETADAFILPRDPIPEPAPYRERVVESVAEIAAAQATYLEHVSATVPAESEVQP